MWGPILRVYLVFFPGKKKVEVSFCQIVTETESEKLKGLDMTYQLSIHWYCLLVHRTMLLGFQSFGKKLSGQSLPILKSYEGLNTHCQSVKQSKLCTKQAQNWPWALFVCLRPCLCLNFADSALSSLDVIFWIFDEVKSLVCQRRGLTKKERRKIFGKGKYLVSREE